MLDSGPRSTLGPIAHLLSLILSTGFAHPPIGEVLGLWRLGLDDACAALIAPVAV